LQRFNAEKSGEKWRIKNKELNVNKIYTVAFSEYLLKGFDIPFLSDKSAGVLSIYKPKENELTFDIRKSVIAYLKLETKKRAQF
jgi:5'-nucleotidase/UDP-sugar diphosphatase